MLKEVVLEKNEEEKNVNNGGYKLKTWIFIFVHYFSLIFFAISNAKLDHKSVIIPVFTIVNILGYLFTSIFIYSAYQYKDPTTFVKNIQEIKNNELISK